MASGPPPQGGAALAIDPLAHVRTRAACQDLQVQPVPSETIAPAGENPELEDQLVGIKVSETTSGSHLDASGAQRSDG